MSVLAHQTWFVHHPEDYPVDLGALTRPAVLAGLAAVVLVAVAWRAVAIRVGPVELRVLRPLGGLAPWVPRLLAVHLGLSLVVLTWTRSVLDPSVVAPDGWTGSLLLAPQAVVGALLVAGVLVRLAAWLVVLAGPVLLVLEGPLSLLVCLVLVGIAGFLVVLPPDPARNGRADLRPARLRPALLLLRVGAAGSLLVLAVVEKLANPAMGEAMLRQEPMLNLLSPLGMSAAAFVVLAGCVEVLFALLVLSGAAPQVVALVAAVPFTASLALFGGTELIGHLPVYGVLLTLLVLGSGTTTAPQVRALTLSGPRG